MRGFIMEDRELEKLLKEIDNASLINVENIIDRLVDEVVDAKINYILKKIKQPLQEAQSSINMIKRTNSLNAQNENEVIRVLKQIRQETERNIDKTEGY